MDDEGFVFIGRIEDMTVSGGENAYSTEVEMQHPAIRTCAVIAVPDPRWGERVHAVLVAKPGATINEAEIVEYCALRIARSTCVSRFATRCRFQARFQAPVRSLRKSCANRTGEDSRAE